jgi:hypothetical protein
MLHFGMIGIVLRKDDLDRISFNMICDDKTVSKGVHINVTERDSILSCSCDLQQGVVVGNPHISMPSIPKASEHLF